MAELWRALVVDNNYTRECVRKSLVALVGEDFDIPYQLSKEQMMEQINKVVKEEENAGKERQSAGFLCVFSGFRGNRGSRNGDSEEIIMKMAKEEVLTIDEFLKPLIESKAFAGKPKIFILDIRKEVPGDNHNDVPGNEKKSYLPREADYFFMISHIKSAGEKENNSRFLHEIAKLRSPDRASINLPEMGRYLRNELCEHKLDDNASYPLTISTARGLYTLPPTTHIKPYQWQEKITGVSDAVMSDD